jgi:GT2 family glycosyltransferase/Tfp pilus assembly protein PilF
MQRRYLFGPVDRNFADRTLARLRETGECLAFNADGNVDLQITSDDTWEAIASRLPAGWQPEFVALYLPYKRIPPALWRAPVPLIGLAADWNMLWHWYRHCLRRCDVILTDTLGVEALTKEGITNAQVAYLYGLDREETAWPLPGGLRDIDVLFAGNFHPAVQRERLSWLGRLAKLSDRHRIVLRTGVFGDDYRQLLTRTRIVFNRSIRGEVNRRAFEAIAAGALLFQEAENLESPTFFQDRQECVYYTDENLETLLEYYLTHEDERAAIAVRARSKLATLSFEAQWNETLQALEPCWPEIAAHARRRQEAYIAFGSPARLWECLSGGGPTTSLADSLAQQLLREPNRGELHSALGVALAHEAQSSPSGLAPSAGRLAGYFQRALRADGQNLVSLLNAVELLAVANQKPAAVDLARRALALVGQDLQDAPAWLDTPRVPAGFDHFRVEWERAAWMHAGQPSAEVRAKRRLIRWRVHALLGELTGDLAHREEAVLARPDLPGSAALGEALAAAGRLPEAVPHLRASIDTNPFDLHSAKTLFEVLGRLEETDGQRRLARDARRLHAAAPEIVADERWFREAPPVGDELASLIILCCNEVEYTRQCLESVLRNTRPPYELVLIDNGSTDGTPAYLEELRQCAGPERVVVVRNETNQGFAAGCNQGLREARGRYLVLLNNDTVVSPRWLDGLVAWSLESWPHVGMVGPVSNYAAAPQQVSVDYQDVADMPGFAARRQQEFAGQAAELERLTGFCLLIRREVLDAIGGLDERFGLGFFEDDDLCVRAREAGFRLLLALNVFVHHYGSRTFQALDIDCRKALTDNLAIFREKWGEERAAQYHPPSELQSEVTPPVERVKDSVLPDSAPMTASHRVSLCVIARNEEANIAACLQSAADLVDEMLVVDTGSTDRTKEIALGLGARVVDFPWIDNFAAARNACLDHATGEWIFWLDADDRLDEGNREKLKTLFSALPDNQVCYAMKCFCLPDPVSKTATIVDHIRLFRRHPDIRWQHRVHEQILPSVRRLGGQVHFSDVVIQHVGYQDPALRGQKLQRDLRLLHLEEQELPDHPFTLFNLGSTYLELKQPAQALPYLQRSLERSHPSDSIVRKLFVLIAVCQRGLGQAPEALRTCTAGREHYPDDAELLFQESIVRGELGDDPGAEDCLLRLLGHREREHFASIAQGLAGHRARHNLAVIYRRQGRDIEATAQLRAALAEAPDFLPAQVALAEVLLAQMQWDEADKVIEVIGARAEERRTWEILRVRLLLGRREFDAALRILYDILRVDPDALVPRILLSHLLLQQGSNWPAAESALHEVLRLDPTNLEARSNLATLHRLQGRSVDKATENQLMLAGLYRAACATPSDIHEHCPVLYELAKGCEHITEFGTRTGVSTTAFLFAQPRKLICYDRQKLPQVDLLGSVAGQTEFVFVQGDVLRVDIEETDLLFIDTWHVYEQLREELRRHGRRTRKYLVLHDTTTYGEVGEAPGHQGLWPAIEEFLAEGHFVLRQRLQNNNGLTVLERRHVVGLNGTTNCFVSL